MILKVSRLSIATPINNTFEYSVIPISLIFRMIDFPVLLPRIINCNFFGLGFVEFTLNYYNIISYLTSLKIFLQINITAIYCIIIFKIAYICSFNKKKEIINK